MSNACEYSYSAAANGDDDDDDDDEQDDEQDDDDDDQDDDQDDDRNISTQVRLISPKISHISHVIISPRS